MPRDDYNEDWHDHMSRDFDKEYQALDFDEYGGTTKGGAYVLWIDGHKVFVPESVCEKEPNTETKELMVEEWWLIDEGFA